MSLLPVHKQSHWAWNFWYYAESPRLLSSFNPLLSPAFLSSLSLSRPISASLSAADRMPRNPLSQDWKTGICDSGDGSDCPRSCFLGCSQFGIIRYRLEKIGNGGNALDLSDYRACNAPCWKYCLLCFGICVS